MKKAVLHNLIDMLDETDTDTIYNVLIRFIPEAMPLDDEIQAIEEAERDIEGGNVMNLSDVDWEAI
ncbi:MAG: hypothetical protein LUG52_09965 [Clostridia bacterium]|nr:hypothetical protein [Clostridia bacterium]